MTLRMTSKLRFALDLLARSQRRTATSVIEEALENLIANSEVGTKRSADGEPSLFHRVWSTHEVERLLNLEEHAPGLVSFEEEDLLRLLRTQMKRQKLEGKHYFVSCFEPDGQPRWDLIRDVWGSVKACAAGEVTEAELKDYFALKFEQWMKSLPRASASAPDDSSDSEA